MLPVTTRRVRNIWDDPIDSVMRELQRNFFRPMNGSDDEFRGLVGSYPVDIREDADHLYVDAEMPGFRKDEITVTFEQGVLTIEGERKVEDDDKTHKHLSERRYTHVRRSFTLPTTVDESKVEAKLTDGVLHLTIDKRPEVKPRKIEVK